MKIKLLSASALFTALIYLATAYLFHINLPFGYIHLGDAFIYLAASFLPMPYAAASAAIGSFTADITTGAAVWALPTLIIKSLMALPFSSNKAYFLTKRNIFAAIFAGVICVIGYAIAQWLIFGAAGIIAGVVPSLLQAGGSAVLYFVIAAALDRAKVKESRVLS